MQRSAPVGVVVICVIVAFFGLLGLCCGPLALLQQIGMNMGDNPLLQGNPMLEAMQSGWMRAWMLFVQIVGLFFSLFMVAGGLGGLKGYGWARILLMGWAVLAVLLNCAGLGVSGWMIAQMAGDLQDPVMIGGAVGGAIGGLCGTGFNLLLPLATLLVITRPSAREWFQAGE